MIAISFSNISLTLGARPIFTHLSWEIQDGQKIGLIGPNGAGKSSLFKLITGEFTPEPGGALVLARGVSLGYLPQHPELDPSLSVMDAAVAGNPRWAELREELELIEASFNDPAVYNHEQRLTRALDRQQACLEEYASLGGDQYPEKVHDLLCGLGLDDTDLDQSLGDLSGGQKKLVGLSRVLLARPSVLLLDEPDNHLDLSGKKYLEGLIQVYPGTVVIVSHDRFLLDACVTHIAELEDGRLTSFAGDYSTYMLDKETRLARQDELYHVQQRQILRIETAIKRYAMWAKVYDSEKFAKRARSIQTRLDKMDRLERPVLERRRMDLALEGWRGSNQVIELKGVSKAYGSLVVLESVDLLLRHGDRVGLIGPNGSGKSVLLRLALGDEQSDSGEVVVGPSVRIGYYAQEHETLNFEQTLIEAVR
ncbi:MAG TPA: ABC-F family ATP-binding cassette domain-containing protein, partial [Anaerolineaceae bacterium]